MGGQHFGPVGEAGADIPPPILIEHDRADLGIPEDFEPLTLSIIGNTREVEGLKVVLFPRDFLDQPGRPRSSTKLPGSRVATTLVCDMSSFFSAFR